MKDFFRKRAVVIIGLILALSIFLTSMIGVWVVTGILNHSFLTNIFKTTETKKPSDDEPDYPDEPDYSDPDSPWIPDNDSDYTNPDNPQIPDDDSKTPTRKKDPSVKTGDIGELFHDQGGIYMSPIQPSSNDRVTIRLRVERNQIKWANINISTDYAKSFISYPLKFNAVEKNGNYEDWAIILPKQKKEYYYYFTAGNDDKDKTVNYGLHGEIEDDVESYNQCFFVKPDTNVPEWSYGIYWYGINTNAFYNSDPMNDASGQYADLAIGQQMNGNHYRSMYGGDLQGITSKLDYIKSLGVEGVYINPIMPSWDAAGYGWLETYSIAQRNGNEEALANLCKAIHNKDMRICLDHVVALFTGNSVWANDKNYNIYPFEGALSSKSSRFFDMFDFTMWPSDYLKRYESIAPDYTGTNAKKAVYSQKGSLIPRYNSAPFNVDSVRFDSAIWLWGSDTPKEQIIKEMKASAKAANPDFLFTAESWQSRIYDWDNTWNMGASDALRDFISYKTTGSKLKSSLTSYLQGISRPAALSTYYYIDMIDRDRIRGQVDSQSFINAGTLIQMTYLGSPSLRYGNETAASTTMAHRINAFDWDESSWDYDNYSYIKTLGQLRNEYSCLKDGVVKFGDINDPEQFLTFARWNNKETVITAVNRSNEFNEQTFDVKQFGLKDSDKLTDYFTGKTYTVKNGKITASIIPGGTVFVTGGKSSNYRNRYNVNKFAAKGGKAVITGVDTYKITNDVGDLSGKSDKGVFALTPMFGNFSIEADISVKNGCGGIAIRDSESADSASYSAVVENGKLTVYARKSSGKKAIKITSGKVVNGSRISVVRGSDNLFKVLVNGLVVIDTKYNVRMGNKVFAGFVGVDGSIDFRLSSLSESDQKYCSDFNSATLASTLDVSGNWSIASGKLNLSSKKSLFKSAEAAYCYSMTKPGDWTAKAVLTSEINADSALAGVYASCDVSNNIFGGRTRINGQNKIVLGRVVNGALSVYASADDTRPNDEITIQLQRTGNYFTLVYKYGSGIWKQLDGRVFSSMISPNVGVYAFGNDVTAHVDSFTFGNMLDGGSSFNIPHTIISWDNKTGGDIKNNVLYTPSWKIKTNTDNWDYVSGGLMQMSDSTEEYLYDDRAKHTDFRAEATVQFKAGNGYTGLLFKKSDTDKNTNNGYFLKINKNGKLQLLKDGIQLKEKSVKIPEMGLRVAVECSGNSIFIYYGTDLRLAFAVNDSTYSSGYFGLVTSHEKAIFGNFDILPNEYKSWTIASPSYPADKIFSFADNKISCNVGSSWAVASYKGYGYTNVEAQTKISATQDENGFAGMTFGISEGVLPNKAGVSVLISGNDKLVINKNGNEVKSCNVALNAENTLKVAVNNGVYTVYVNGVEKLSWADNSFGGGAVSLTGYNTKAVFSDFSVNDKTN